MIDFNYTRSFWEFMYRSYSAHLQINPIYCIGSNAGFLWLQHLSNESTKVSRLKKLTYYQGSDYRKFMSIRNAILLYFRLQILKSKDLCRKEA
jgi:hypothetical protein